jgi:hypothetical protein
LRGRYLYHIFSCKHAVHVDMAIMGTHLKSAQHSDHYGILNLSAFQNYYQKYKQIIEPKHIRYK